MSDLGDRMQLPHHRLLEWTQCLYCQHHYYDDGQKCAAFPDGIPDAILTNEADHREPFPGDKGLRFLPTETDDYHPKDKNSVANESDGLTRASLGGLAERLHALEANDKTPFQRQARILQSLWREEMGYPIGEHRDRPLGSSLPMPWAQETLANFLDDAIRQVVREELLEPKKAKGKLFGRPRLFNNLLSSQPLAFNLFAHLKVDLALATQVFSTLTDDRCYEVTSVEFEHSPGRGDDRYTGDKSAFDVYVTFLGPDGESGFVGIEVKYHEGLGESPSPHKPRYDEVAQAMGCFDPDAMQCLQQKPIQQIWRDHLLAGSLRQVDGFDDGLFVFLSPRDNEACNQAVAQYRACLTDERSFEHWTLERVVEVARQFTDAPWVENLYSRYLDFSKIQDQLA